MNLEECIAREPDRSRLREVFREFELRAPLERLEEALGSDEAAPEERHEEVVAVRARSVEVAELGALDGELVAVAALRPGEELDAPPPAPDPEEELALDDPIEHDEAAAEAVLEEPAAAAPSPAAPAQGTLDFEGSFRGPLTVAAYAGDDVLVAEAETLAAFALARGDRPVVAHDWKTLAMADEACDAPPLAHDTMVAAYLIDPARRGYPLDELAAEAGLGVEVDGADGVAKRAVLTRLVAERQRERLEEDGLTRLLEEIELPLVDVLVEMERAGVKLDVKRLREIAGRFGERAKDLERRVWDLAGEEFTIGSPQQLAPILFDKLGLSKKRRGKTGFSTDARVLQAIRDEHEIVPAIEEWREVTKLKSTYLDAFPELIADDGRLHTTFNQTAATTGRLSSTNPNLQNIPIRTEQGREIRACFVAEPGHSLISADYSQVELRLLAHIADEPVLKEIFRRGEDVHTATAEAILGGKTDPGTRSKAKMVNYGIVYGLSAFGLADRLQIEREEAQEFIDRYLERFPAVAAFIASTVEQATEDGHVTTLFGRIRRVPELRARNRQTRLLGERLAVNMIIQGTAADIIKVAMVRARDRLREAGPRHPPGAPDPRRAAVRGARRRGGRRRGDRARRDGRGLRHGPAARGGRGRGPELARGQVVDRGVAVLLTAFAGGLVAMQAPINANLGRTVGSLPAASISFAIGLVALVSITAARRGRLRQGRRDRRPLLVLPHRRAARRRVRDDGADLGQDARRRRRHGRHDRGSADAVGDPGPARGARAREARPVRRAHRRAWRCSPRARSSSSAAEPWPALARPGRA